MSLERDISEECRLALANSLKGSFPEARLEEFGLNTPNPGVRADVHTHRGIANIHLWRNRSFDVDAVENVSGRLLVHKSIEDATPLDVTTTIADLRAALL